MSQQYEAAPQAPPGSYSSGPSGPRAGFWRRFAAWFVDGLVLAIPAGILYAIDPTLSNIGSTIISALYFTLMDGGPRGQTLGKMALGIRVYDFREGGAIGYGRGFIRWLVASTISLFFLLGYLWMLWDREKQTWQDKLAGSVVVPVDAYR